VRYLAEEARRAGVRHLDAVITAAVPSADRRDIDHLRTEDGRELRYDLYVDCTGFRSLLLEKALGSEYLSFASSLFNDSAVMANVPHDGLIKPYTVAETMDNGWCWNIPTPDEDHRGYVFSSAFATVEQATEEMRRKNPRMGDTWSLKFRSGRHAEFWRGNCVAIGNSFAFVEPLQSTAIHMAIVQIKKLVSSFPRQTGLHTFQPLVNREINEVWDTLRWFLAAHYRYNRRLDSAYWRECRKSVDVAGIDEIVALYRERAPIGATAQRFKELDLSTFGVYRYDLLFMGMGLEAEFAEPDDDVATWKRAVLAAERLAKRGVLHSDALRALVERPELLRRHATDLAAT
jgi:tryptophan halogenase